MLSCKTKKGIVIPMDVGWSDVGIGNLFGKILIKIRMEMLFREK